jgi:sec-independent protein translocase protein TatB
MSLSDTIFILIGALLLFGPKKLPELARQVGKIMGELRRASNEFKFQMEEELRMSEDTERRNAAPSVGQSLMSPLATPPAPAIQPPATGEPVANRISVRAAENPSEDGASAQPELSEPAEPAEAAPHA